MKTATTPRAGQRRLSSGWLRRPVGSGTTLVLGMIVCAAPAWLFADRLSFYRLHSDDFAYVAASRSFSRTIANLFVAHNTHIVPAWRLLTFALTTIAGRLANLRVVLDCASYGVFAATMILAGRFVTRETGRAGVGLAAMVALGTTSLLERSATWYSAGQTLWAGTGVLAMLLFLQGWRRSGGAWRLVLAAFAAWFAGGMWTIGHAAGPVGAAYLWADGRPCCRKAAAVPLAATGLTILVALAMGAHHINASFSFHGRTADKAIRTVEGLSHTLQAVPEDLILGNLGVVPETTPEQGAALSLVLAGVWGWTRRGGLKPLQAWAVSIPIGLVILAVVVGAFRYRLAPELWPMTAFDLAVISIWIALLGRATPREAAGGTLVLSAYFVEWSFRGYLAFEFLRGIVPWYDTIPQIGAVLFGAGWWSACRPVDPAEPPPRLTRGAALAVLLFQAAMIVAHQPRVDAIFLRSVPGLTPEEEAARIYMTPELLRLRALYLAEERTKWQQRHLVRLDQAEAVARRLGIGRKAIGETFGRVLAPEIPPVYDATGMLDLPWEGKEHDPAVIRRELGPFFEQEPEPAPPPLAVLRPRDVR